MSRILKSVWPRMVNPYHTAMQNFRLYLPMNEGTGGTAYDLSGQVNHGTISGALWTGGEWGTALRFDGSNDEVITANNIGISGASARTVLAKVNIVAFSGNPKIQGVVAWGAESARTGCILGVIGSTGQLFAWGHTENLGGSILSIGQWYRIGFTYDGATTLRLYIDGVEDSNGSISESAWNTPNSKLYVCNSATLFPINGEYLQADVEYVMVWNRALTAGEIAALHRNPYILQRQ